MSVLDQLLVELNDRTNQQNKHVPIPSGGNGYQHGPGGMFGISGLERDVISSRMQVMGLASELPVKQSVMEHPLFAYVTGFRASTGEQPTAECDLGPEAGAMKTCIQTAQFGQYQFSTRAMDIYRTGQINDRGEFLDLRLVNDPLVNLRIHHGH